MARHVKRIECCYCGASSLVNLDNPNAMQLICSGCNARMSVDRMQPLAPAAAAPVSPPPARSERTVVFEPPRDDRRRRDDNDDDDDDHRDRRPRKKKRRKTFLKRLEDIWDEIEDIFD